MFRAPDGLFVNLEIVRQGYGHAYVKYPFEHMELFRHYESRARRSGKGLWSGAAPESVSKAKGRASPKPAAKPETTFKSRCRRRNNGVRHQVWVKVPHGELPVGEYSDVIVRGSRTLFALRPVRAAGMKGGQAL